MAKTTCEYKEPDIADSELQVTLSPNVFALQRPPPPGGLCGAGGQHGVTPQPALPEEKPSAAVPGKLRGRRGVILTGTRSKQAADGLRCVKLRKNGLKQTNLLWNLWGDPAPTAARSNAPEWRHRAAHPRGDTEGSNPASAGRPRAASLGSAGRQSRSEMNNAEPTRVNPTGGRWMEVTALLSFITEQLPEIQWAR